MTDSNPSVDNGDVKLVKIKHDYSYKSDSDRRDVSFKAGEKYFLVIKTSENWWYVKKRLEDEQGVYVPAQYVKEVKTIKAKTSLSPASAPVTGSKPSLKISPKILQSESKLESTPSLNNGAIEELDKLLSDLRVPEAFQDTEQAPQEPTGHSNGTGDQTSTAACQSPDPPLEDAVTSEVSQRSPLDRQSKEETRLESETSDYKTDSRESLDSEGRGFEAGEEATTRGVKVKEEVDKGSQDVVS